MRHREADPSSAHRRHPQRPRRGTRSPPAAPAQKRLPIPSRHVVGGEGTFRGGIQVQQSRHLPQPLSDFDRSKLKRAVETRRGGGRHQGARGNNARAYPRTSSGKSGVSWHPEAMTAREEELTAREMPKKPSLLGEKLHARRWGEAAAPVRYVQRNVPLPSGAGSPFEGERHVFLAARRRRAETGETGGAGGRPTVIPA